MEDGTSGVDDTGLDSSEVEDENQLEEKVSLSKYSLVSKKGLVTPLTKNTILNFIHDEDFISQYASGEIGVNIEDDEAVSTLLKNSVEAWKQKNQKQEESIVKIDDPKDDDNVNPTKPVEESNLIPINTKNKKININNIQLFIKQKIILGLKKPKVIVQQLQHTKEKYETQS